MSLLDAIKAIGVIPPATASREAKKRYSERLSQELAFEVAAGLRAVGFPNVRPLRGGPGEKEFQGGLGPKKVDASYSDERHGLLLAVSIKSICFRPYGKNLKNRFGDLCTEAIALHIRFPYGVVCALFAMPEEADLDRTALRRISTFQRAGMLPGTIGERQDYASAGERFEDVTVLLFRPLRDDGQQPWVKLFRATPRQPMKERYRNTEMDSAGRGDALRLSSKRAVTGGKTGLRRQNRQHSGPSSSCPLFQKSYLI